MARPFIGASVAFALATATGCGADAGVWDGVPIEEAWLEEFDLSALAIAAGTMQGDALLVFEESGGTVSSLPVHLGGGSLGVAMDMSIDPEGHEGAVDIDLSDVRDPTVGDVLGTYHGTGAAGAAFVGGSRRRMRNGEGASFREDHFVIGLSIFFGYEWITIREGGDDAFVTAVDPYDSYASGTDTGLVPPDETGVVPPDDTGPTIAVAGPSAGCETQPEETEPEPSSSGCDGSDDGCDACSQAAITPVWMTWIALLLLRRRR
jgi:hypothetical protein